jgi:hypothetical protein
MQSDANLAENYRKEANKFSETGISTAILAVALVAVFVAGAIRVEECRIVPGFFGSASRRVCEPSALAFVLGRKVDGAIRSIVLR